MCYHPVCSELKHRCSSTAYSTIRSSMCHPCMADRDAVQHMHALGGTVLTTLHPGGTHLRQLFDFKVSQLACESRVGRSNRPAVFDHLECFPVLQAGHSHQVHRSHSHCSRYARHTAQLMNGSNHRALQCVSDIKLWCTYRV